jgi:hypothetical protein
LVLELFSFVSSLIAGPTSCDDVLCRIEATVLPCFKVLCGALKRKSLRWLEAVGLAERFEIVVPHRQTTVVAAAQLGKVCGMTTTG